MSMVPPDFAATITPIRTPWNTVPVRISRAQLDVVWRSAMY
jgi:hypothetical protein